MGIIIALVAIFVFKQDPMQVIGGVLQNQQGQPQVEAGPYETLSRRTKGYRFCFCSITRH